RFREERNERIVTNKMEEATKKIKPTDCAKCNKPLRKKIWYYRDGKYYCNKRCWRLSTKSEKSPTPT
ncbi:MAG: hypothetical protein NC828_05935, partial [Candidatus Omnitrophica bacterium]|nr:hypothetical protein [Candidatus Omnitrophota bacterium]